MRKVRLPRRGVECGASQEILQTEAILGLVIFLAAKESISRERLRMSRSLIFDRRERP